MSHKLITFLGRGAQSRNGQRLPYRSARYRFEGPSEQPAWTSEPVLHLASAITLYQTERGTPLNAISVFGTTGSMWDVLLDNLDDPGDDFFAKLIDEIDQDSTSIETLNQLETLINQGGPQYSLQLMPPAVAAAGQAQLLSTLVNEIDAGDHVWIDVTNGYRHLPMLGLASASLAARAKSAHIDQISYGAFEMAEEGITPVISLGWILNLLSVSASVHELKRSRQLRPIIDCFPDGPVRSALQDADFSLNTMRVDEAVTKVRLAMKEIRKWGDEVPTELKPVIDLLLESLAPLTRQQRTVRGLVDMADHALRSGDYLRTSVFLSEAVSRAIAIGLPGDETQDQQLKRARNYLAHAGHNNTLGDVASVFDSPRQLRNFFQQNIERLRHDMNEAEDVTG